MVLVMVIAACFAMLFVVEVLLGAPEGFFRAEVPAGGRPSATEKTGVRDFFGRALPIAAAGVGLPMSLQHPWAVLLVLAVPVLYLTLGRGRHGA